MDVLENVKVKGKVAEGGVVDQDIGGWKTMPPEHWERVAERLIKSEQEVKRLLNEIKELRAR